MSLLKRKSNNITKMINNKLKINRVLNKKNLHMGKYY